MTVAEHTHHDAMVSWDGRILAAKLRQAGALAPEEIKIVDATANQRQ